MIYRVAFRGEHLAAQGMTMYGGGMTEDNLVFVARFGADGNEINRYDEWKSGFDFTRPIKVDEMAEYHCFNNWDMDRNGRIFHTVARDSYVIGVAAPDGSPLFRIQRDWSPHRRSNEEKDEAKNGYSFSSTGELPPISYAIADEDPAIGELRIVGEELWITSPQHDRKPPPGTAGAVSVFDLDGHLQEERQFILPMNREEDLVKHLPDGRIVRVKAYRSAQIAADTELSVVVEGNTIVVSRVWRGRGGVTGA